jgi:hypothetical protein
MRTRHIAGIATTGILLLSGCGTSEAGGGDTAQPQTATTTTTSPSPPPPPSFRLGQALNWSNPTGARGTTTVLSYQQPVPHLDPPDPSLGVPAGSQWGRIDIRVCQSVGPSIGVSQTPWSLLFADGSRAEITGEFGGNIPKPEWPQDASVNAGDCIRGGIVFPIPKGERPVRVLYAPESVPAPVQWVIPAT